MKLRHRPSLAVAVAASSLLVLAPAGQAHAPGVSLTGFGTPVIDGVFSPGEWAAAGSLEFDVKAPDENATDFPLPSTTTPATLYTMNDHDNLYLALRVQRPYLGTSSFAVEFDNNDSGGLREEGDDVFVLDPPNQFFDDYRTYLPPCPSGAQCGLFDATAGGTNDGRGAGSNDGAYSVYEVSKPLNDTDDAHDFSLHPGDTVGFQVFLRLFNQRGACCADTTYPLGNFGDIVIQPTDREPPALTVTASPTTLWPPNHRLVDVSVLTDAEDASGIASVILVSATSSELDDAPGDCDGATAEDIQGATLGSDDTLVSVRAERACDGPGRTYTLTYRATDRAGNSTESSTTIFIPHDES